MDADNWLMRKAHQIGERWRDDLHADHEGETDTYHKALKWQILSALRQAYNRGLADGMKGGDA